MTQSWYFKSLGKEVGPISSAELRHMAEQGNIDKATLVRLAGTEKWKRASKVTGLFDGLQESRPPPPPTAFVDGFPAPVAQAPLLPDSPLPNAKPRRRAFGWVASSCAVFVLLVAAGWFISKSQERDREKALEDRVQQQQQDAAHREMKLVQAELDAVRQKQLAQEEELLHLNKTKEEAERRARAAEKRSQTVEAAAKSTASREGEKSRHIAAIPRTPAGRTHQNVEAA